MLENRICSQIQDLHASFDINETGKHKRCSRNFTYTLSTPEGSNLTVFFVLWVVVFDILTIFQNYPIWA